MKRFLVVISVIGLLLVFSFPVKAYYTNMPASGVIGQPDFKSSSPSVTSSTFSQNNLQSLFIDPVGRLIVVDTGNNRVLIWNKVPPSGLTPADVVLGQPDFSSSSANNGGQSGSTLNSPSTAFSDGQRLLIGDNVNSRTLLWNTFPTRNGQAADVVIGQSTMSSSSITCDSSHTRNNIGAVIYNGKLIMGSPTQERILIWNSIPTQNGQAADVVLGWSDFITCDFNLPAAATSSNIGAPRGLMVDSNGKLFVVDRGFQRILIWNQIPTINNTPADVVVGQSSFTAGNGTALNPPTSESLNTPQDLLSNGKRLFVGDNQNHRILVWNEIPTKNGQPADLVLGQSNFTNNTSNQGGTTAANTIGRPRSMFEYKGKLYITDEANSRILVYDNILSTPALNINLPLTYLSNGNLRVYGNVLLGERGTYGLQWVKAEVNGQGLGNVTSFGGGRDNGINQTLYDFSHDFNPGNVLNSDINNFTLLLQASSFNADTSSLFYFQPFKLNSVTNNTYDFSVNKYQIQKIKDNVGHFEIWAGKTLFISGISPSLIDTNGSVSVSSSTPGISFPNTVLPGTYDIKIRAVSKNSNSGFDTNTITNVSLTGTNGNSNISTTQAMVLQINNISDTNTGILSSFNTTNIKPNYTTTNNLHPVFSGISWAGSIVSLNVTNKDNTSQFKTYSVNTNSDSSFTINPTLYPNSIINFSVTKDGMYNFIPLFDLNR